MAEASVAVPPIRKVAATNASAIRGWVTVPSTEFLILNIDLRPSDNIATNVASGTPVPKLTKAVWFPIEA